MHLYVTMLLMGMRILAKAGTPRIDMEIISRVQLWHLTSDIYKDTHIFSFWHNSFVSASMVEKKKKFAQDEKSFLDMNWMLLQDNVGVVSIMRPHSSGRASTLFCLTSQYPSSSPPNTQNSCFRLLSVSPLSQLVSSFHAFAQAVFAIWSAFPHLSRKFPSVSAETAPKSLWYLSWGEWRQELVPPLHLPDKEYLQILYVFFTSSNDCFLKTEADQNWRSGAGTTRQVPESVSPGTVPFNTRQSGALELFLPPLFRCESWDPARLQNMQIEQLIWHRSRTQSLDFDKSANDPIDQSSLWNILSPPNLVPLLIYI